MMSIFLLLIFNTLFIIGVWQATKPGNILGFINYYDISEDLAKPLFKCPKCMASIHSILPFWIFAPFGWSSLLIYFFYIFALAGAVSAITNLIDFDRWE